MPTGMRDMVVRSLYVANVGWQSPSCRYPPPPPILRKVLILNYLIVKYSIDWG